MGNDTQHTDRASALLAALQTGPVEDEKPVVEDGLPLLRSLDQFLFEVPLYSPCRLQLSLAPRLYLNRNGTVDGRCVQCGREATFNVKLTYPLDRDSFAELRARHAYDILTICCARNEKHQVRYWFLIKDLIVQKVGQYPSLADIANDEVKAYRNLLTPSLAAEFHKAVGLAAHGVGVGSFVYLRRIFERLIQNRFDELKDTEGWDADAFKRGRMEDKIDTLKDHLPDFLVTNRRIYSILSIGIHELGEKECLGYFDVMRQSIVMILEDDKKKREDRERREVFKRAIADFKVS